MEVTMPPVTTTTSRKFLIVAVLLSISTLATAQRGASLRGQVTDQLGAVIVAASITLIDQSGKEQTTQTDDRGSYHFNGLAPGAYSLKVRQAGFANYDQTSLSLGSGLTTH